MCDHIHRTPSGKSRLKTPRKTPRPATLLAFCDLEDGVESYAAKFRRVFELLENRDPFLRIGRFPFDQQSLAVRRDLHREIGDVFFAALLKILSDRLSIAAMAYRRGDRRGFATAPWNEPEQFLWRRFQRRRVRFARIDVVRFRSIAKNTI